MGAGAAVVDDVGEGGQDGVEQLRRPSITKSRERVEVTESLERRLGETSSQSFDERLVGILRRTDEKILKPDSGSFAETLHSQVILCLRAGDASNSELGLDLGNPDCGSMWPKIR